MQNYDHRRIEKKWQRIWEKERVFEARDKSKKPKFYGLIEFPYPSGDGLHVGHIRSNTAMDVIARKRRAEGFNVLYPIGWDAFGLPTENYAVKTGIHSAKVTKQNTDTFRRQLKSLGFSFDWSREINTTDPAYYKWTQWIFLKMFEKGLAYKKKMAINWCPSCKIGLANEEVVDGACERCGTTVEKRDKEQWMLAITKYADRLDKDLDTVDYLSRIKTQQRNWIGRSEGSEIRFKIYDLRFKKEIKEIKVFTTRPDTLFGATYLVLAPEHPFVTEQIRNPKSEILNKSEIQNYVNEAKNRTEIERTAEGKEKTGVELKGIKAINPANDEEIPVWLADYVLAEYGTGAVMAVPAHDGRDFVFASRYNLPIVPVIYPRTLSLDQSDLVELEKIPVQDISARALFFIGQRGAYVGEGVVINSPGFDGKSSEVAKSEIAQRFGVKQVQYKLRDWVFSRQRYWGEPIPLVFCESCKTQVENPKSQAPRLPIGGQANPKQVPNPKILNAKRSLRLFHYTLNAGEERNPGWFAVSEKDLPVKLPNVENYKPTDTGESPLAPLTKWVNVKCPKCKGEARRETDTMPNWAGSSWYYLRYLNPHNTKQFVGKKQLKYWCGDSGNLKAISYKLNAGPVDWYNGGMEHTTLHLLYSRFWHKFLFDLGLVPTSEPYGKRTSHGLILAEGGVKMSKSKGNVINPDDLIVRFGADSVRLYEMFMGPFDQPISWDENGIVGTRRFLERVWRLRWRISSSRIKAEGLRIEPLLHQTIRKVTNDIEEMRFNTAVSALMILLNSLEKETVIPLAMWKTFIQLLAPFAPHLSEELWSRLGYKKSILFEPWPVFDEKITFNSSVTIVVQVNGRTRGTFTAGRGDKKEKIQAASLILPEIRKWTEGRDIKTVIVVPDRLVNIVVV